MRRTATALLLLVLGLAGPGAAHHSLAAYDHARTLSLTGVISAFHYTQPHPFLIIDAGGAAWKLEMDNLSELDEAGIDPHTFKPGDRVQVTGDPMRDGSRQMYLRRLDRTSDGLRYEQVGFTPVLTKTR